MKQSDRRSGQRARSKAASQRVWITAIAVLAALFLLAFRQGLETRYLAYDFNAPSAGAAHLRLLYPSTWHVMASEYGFDRVHLTPRPPVGPLAWIESRLVPFGPAKEWDILILCEQNTPRDTPQGSYNRLFRFLTPENGFTDVKAKIQHTPSGDACAWSARVRNSSEIDMGVELLPESSDSLALQFTARTNRAADVPRLSNVINDVVSRVTLVKSR